MTSFASRPTRGAWIETPSLDGSVLRATRAPHGARGLKHLPCQRRLLRIGSRPTRGAWIETCGYLLAIVSSLVAPHTGRVD